MRRAALPIVLLVVALVLGGLAWQAGSDRAAATGTTAHGAATPVLSVRRIPEWLASPGADARLRTAVDAVVAASPEATCLTVSAGGRTIYEHNPVQPLPPASTEKLVTAVVALDQLGPGSRFHTQLVAPAGMVNGEVQGNAFLVGGGDPLLSTIDYSDHFENQPQVATSLESFADKLARSGLKRITGRLLGDESRYDQVRAVATWPPRFVTQNESGPLSALTVNDNFATFPANQPVGVTIAGTQAADPPSFAAQKLGELLQARGVRVEGGYGAGTAPKGAKRIGLINSPPLRGVVQELLSESDNQTGELLVKELGRVKGGAGSTAAGLQVITRTLTRLHLVAPGLAVNDGSGLDEGDRTTCRLLTALLDRAGRRSPIGDALPVAGKTGTLVNRFLASPGKGRLRAKTGTLNNATALSGFVDTVPGATLTFSYIATGQPVNEALLQIQEVLGAALVGYPEGPPLAMLGPQAS